MNKKNVKAMELKLGQTVFHKELYDGNWPFKVAGIRKHEIELEGDYSGGTNEGSHKEWYLIEGVLVDA